MNTFAPPPIRVLFAPVTLKSPGLLTFAPVLAVPLTTSSLNIGLVCPIPTSKLLSPVIHLLAPTPIANCVLPVAEGRSTS